jgi:hypothetical protein
MGLDSSTSARWRWLPVLVVSLFLVVIYGGSALRGDSPAAWWKAWGVPAMEPVFFDASVIGAWFDLHRAGEDPAAANPLDPLERTLNYPSTIFVFSASGWSRANTPLFGVGFALLYVGCVALLSRGVTRNGALYWAALACAPAGLLAVERANLDILVLGLVVLAMRLSHRPWVAALFLSLAAIWKLFPIAGMGALLAGNRVQRVAGGVALALCLGVFWLMRDSISTTMGSLSQESTTAFGVYAAGNFWLGNGDPGGLGSTIRALSLPLAIVFAGGAGLAGIFWRGPMITASPQDTFGAWLGALLFGVLFLSGTQFDYKLLFLWPMVPWVWKNAFPCRGGESTLAGLWLLFLLLASWWLFFSTDTSWRFFFLKQSLVWFLFIATAFFGGRLAESWFQTRCMRNFTD